MELLYLNPQQEPLGAGGPHPAPGWLGEEGSVWPASSGPWGLPRSLETKRSTGTRDSPQRHRLPRPPALPLGEPPDERGPGPQASPATWRGGVLGGPLTGKTLCAQVTGEERGHSEDGQPLAHQRPGPCTPPAPPTPQA